jgi:hypothetical protein
MAILKRFLNFYINTSIHVASSACALTWITLIQFGIAHDENSLFFVFFASVTGYNFVKYFGIAKFHHRSLAGWLKTIQVFSLLAFMALCYFALKLETDSLVLIAILGVITFLYAVPLLPKKYFIDEQKNLRQISGLKVYIIALVWTFATVVLPLVNNEVTLDYDVWITVLQRFIFVIALMLPFEIRDLNYDSLKLATIPQKIGIKKTKVFGVLLLIVFVLLEFFKDSLSNGLLITSIIIAFVTLLFVMCSHKKQSQYYSAFWVEGLPIFWLILVLMFG